MIWNLGREQVQAGGRYAWEYFRDRLATHSFTLGDYWAFTATRLASTGPRRALAEFLVLKAMDPAATASPAEPPQGADLLLRSGLAIRVESAMCVQGWPRDRLEATTFDIAPRWAWNERSGRPENHLTRVAHIYVFALLRLDQKRAANPIDADHWTFYVAATRAIDAVERAQPLITLKTLDTRARSTDPMWRGPVPFYALRMEVESLGVSLLGKSR